MIAAFALRLLPPSARRRNLIEKAVRLTFLSEKPRIPGEINIIFVGRRRILEINRRFLNHGNDTDVIAFRYDSALPKGDEAPFGDIFISTYQARVQARRLGHPVLTEVLTLAVHGALHLMGYDDRAPRQKAAMSKKQDAILAQLLP